jgi:hypothetical protein
VEFERYFSYAAVWAFGGTLAVDNRESFSNWWRSQFDQHIDYPDDGTVSPRLSFNHFGFKSTLIIRGADNHLPNASKIQDWRVKLKSHLPAW